VPVVCVVRVCHALWERGRAGVRRRGFVCAKGVECVRREGNSGGLGFRV
jgi:hypothetical protein